MKPLVLITLLFIYSVFIIEPVYSKSYHVDNSLVPANLKLPEIPKRPTLEELAILLANDAKIELQKYKNPKLRKLVNEENYKENKK